MIGLLAGAAFLLAAGLGMQAVPGIALLAVAWVLRSQSAQSRRRVLIAALIVSSSVAGALRTNGLELEAVVFQPGVLAVRGEVRKGVAHTAGFQRFVLDVREIQGADSTWDRHRGTLRVGAPLLPKARAGDVVRLEGRLFSLDAEPPGYRSYLRREGIDASFNARSVVLLASGRPAERFFDDVRLRIDGVLRTGAPGDSGALLSGLVTGDDESLSRDRKEAVRRAGLSHVTAISGSNIALLATVVAGSGSGTRRYRSIWRLGITVLVIWAYALVVQMDPPVVRAALVASLALAGIQAGRRPDYVTLTVLTAVAMVLVQPEFLLGLSFRLSFAAALALVVTTPGDLSTSPTPALLRTVLAVTVAQCATLPLLLPLQDRLSLTAVPANLLAGPVVAALFAVALLAGLVGFIWPGGGESLAASAGVFADILLRAVDVLGAPSASLPLWTLSATTVIALGALIAAAIWGCSDESAAMRRRWLMERKVQPKSLTRR